MSRIRISCHMSEPRQLGQVVAVVSERTHHRALHSSSAHRGGLGTVGISSASHQLSDLGQGTELWASVSSSEKWG